MAKSDIAKVQAHIIAKAGRSAAFRSRLVKATHRTLAAEGLKVPRGFKVKVVQDTPKLVHIVLPSKRTAKAKRPGGKKGRMGAMFTFDDGDDERTAKARRAGSTKGRMGTMFTFG